MKIINIDKGSLFSDVVRQLEDQVIASDFTPNLIVGIPTGGHLVVNAMKKLTNGIDVCFISKQRKSTVTKKKLKLSQLLPYLPRSINNILRKVESWLREQNFKYNRDSLLKNQVDTIEIDNQTRNLIKNSKYILIVDDAIDSGQTMKAVVETIQKYRHDTLIKIAVINTTFDNPLVAPDYIVFLKQIVRYPWASDVGVRHNQVS